MAADALDELRRRVVDDPALWARLLAMRERAAFAAEVLAVARELGIALSDDAVADGLTAARREYRARWV